MGNHESYKHILSAVCLKMTTKRNRVRSSTGLFNRNLDEDLCHSITVNETRICHYIPETKQQSLKFIAPGEPVLQNYKEGRQQTKHGDSFWDTWLYNPYRLPSKKELLLVNNMPTC